MTLQFLVHETLCRVMAQLTGLTGRWNLVCVLVSEALLPSLQMNKDAIVLTPISASFISKTPIFSLYGQCVLLGDS